MVDKNNDQKKKKMAEADKMATTLTKIAKKLRKGQVFFHGEVITQEEKNVLEELEDELQHQILHTHDSNVGTIEK
ncbi:MAG: hypothetical protein JSV04_11090 [Candidatus Heimdallarchaeota archaeon]|nr:MAG: hypothetical protein JSV04_11090 [Candidatus Heimdallarchaeota archaeon]